MLLLSDKVVDWAIPRLLLKLKLTVFDRQLHSFGDNLGDVASDVVLWLPLVVTGHDDVISVDKLQLSGQDQDEM